MIVFTFQGLWNQGSTVYIQSEQLKTINYALSQIMAGGSIARAGAGAAATLGQFGVTLAYLHAPAKEISVFDYTQVLFSAALGFFMFGQIPDGLSVLGYIVICGVSVAMFCYNRHLDAGEKA